MFKERGTGGMAHGFRKTGVATLDHDPLRGVHGNGTQRPMVSMSTIILKDEPECGRMKRKGEGAFREVGAQQEEEDGRYRHCSP